MYTYRAIVDRWVDGDTVDLVVDLGFTVQVRTRFRLLGIDTPEVNRIASREAGNAAADFARGLAPAGSEVHVVSHKTGKYGRWLGVVTPIIDDAPAAVSVNDALLDSGHAVPYT
jgi:micrococcal nuclease